MAAAPRPESQVAGDFSKSQTASEIASRKRSAPDFSGEGTEAVSQEELHGISAAGHCCHRLPGSPRAMWVAPASPA
jgi:hypothetical protein